MRNLRDIIYKIYHDTIPYVPVYRYMNTKPVEYISNDVLADPILLKLRNILISDINYE